MNTLLTEGTFITVVSVVRIVVIVRHLLITAVTVFLLT